MLAQVPKEWHKIGPSPVEDLSDFRIRQGIEMKLKTMGQKDLSIAVMHFIKVVIELFVRNRGHSMKSNLMVNTWVQGSFIKVTLPEVKSMRKCNETKEQLLVKLRVNHQKFLGSKMATSLKANSTPEISIDELQAQLKDIDIPLSAFVYEGRKGNVL